MDTYQRVPLERFLWYFFFMHMERPPASCLQMQKSEKCVIIDIVYKSFLPKLWPGKPVRPR
jgi:hypothetical protein